MVLTLSRRGVGAITHVLCLSLSHTKVSLKGMIKLRTERRIEKYICEAVACVCLMMCHHKRVKIKTSKSFQCERATVRSC